MKAKLLVIHHSASPATTTVDDIRRWHVQGNGWSDVGYHKIIKANGSISQGRADVRPGAHAPGVNSSSLGICLIGDFSTVLPPAAQRKTLVQTLASLCKRYGLTSAAIIGHRDAGAAHGYSTRCPGDALYNDLPAIRREVDRYLK